MHARGRKVDAKFWLLMPGGLCGTDDRVFGFGENHTQIAAAGITA